MGIQEVEDLGWDASVSLDLTELEPLASKNPDQQEPVRSWFCFVFYID